MTNPAFDAVPGEALAAAPATRLRVLVLDEYFPYPPDSGKPIRSWNLLSRLAARHDITFICHGHLSPDQINAARAANIRVESVNVIPPDTGIALYGKLLLNLFSRYPYSVSKHYTARFQQKTDALLARESFDLVHCEWTPYARYVKHARVPTLVATHNIESQIWRRRAERTGNPLGKIFFRLQAAKMERFERAALSAATAVTGVSAADASQAKAWGAKHSSVVDNGVDLERFSPQGEGDGHRAVFVGALDWFPNVDAVQYFAEAILPELQRVAPGITTKIIGRKSPESLKKFLEGRTGMEFAGEVPDTRPHLTEAGVVIVPLRIGGGSRLKILEALAMSKAVVSTTIGAEGLAVTSGKNILLADTPREFASAMEELASSPRLRKELGAAGRTLVEQSYGWEALSRKAEQAWLETARPSEVAK